MLDLIDKWNLSFGDVVAFALKCGQLHVALRILRKCTDVTCLRKTDGDGRTLLHVLALSSASSGEMNRTQITVVDKLFDAGIPPSAVDKFGCNFFHYCGFNHAVGMASHCWLKIRDEEEIEKIFSARTNVLKQTVATSVVWKIGAAGGGENAKNEAISWISSCECYGGDLNATAIFPEVKPTDFGEFAGKFDHLKYFTEGGGENAAESKLAEKTLLQIGKG